MNSTPLSAVLPKKLRIAAAMESYAEERITQGMGVEISGMTRAEFIDELARRQIPVCQVHLDEIWGDGICNPNPNVLILQLSLND